MRVIVRRFGIMATRSMSLRLDQCTMLPKIIIPNTQAVKRRTFSDTSTGTVIKAYLGVEHPAKWHVNQGL